MKNLGLTTTEAEKRLEMYGTNELVPEKKSSFFMKILEVLKEPMFMLLIAASVIYFILGEPRDGAIMLIFVMFVIGIDVVQEWKTDKTLNALRDLSSPHATVIRDGKEELILSKFIVPGDVVKISEGEKVPADGNLIKLNDLCVDESSLTGESQGVWKTLNDEKDEYWKTNRCYAGTVVTQGSGYIEADKTGLNSEYGKIGANVAAVTKQKTPLQKQTSVLVKYSAILGAILFSLVCVITFFNVHEYPMKHRIIESVLSGITLAMALIPEEFPVVLTVFLSLGAWRLAKKSSLIRRLPSIETLGCVSVLCVDKTGTLTKNQMEVTDAFTFNSDKHRLCGILGKACEINPYDPMEKAMLAYCENNGLSSADLFDKKLYMEYPFTNQTKRMGHVWEIDEETAVVTAKGSPETIFELCSLAETDKLLLEKTQYEFASRGLRVIAVASAEMNKKEIPGDMAELKLELTGLVGLADPPKEAVPHAIKECRKAGIRVVMITGDNGITATSIARQIGFTDYEEVITGAEIDNMTDEELKERLPHVSIFARVVPEHKMRIVKCFKELGHIVAMTGDGVNDAPALKYADIGVAMGGRGTEVAREASDMVLLDDNFTTIVETIKDGRRIYDNILKAVSYIISIHIPIALAALLAPLLDIPPECIMFLPLHVVLMELVIDPTCSIVFERQQPEPNIMRRNPRNPITPLVTKGIFLKSVFQGLCMFAASFGIYYFTLKTNGNAALARSMGIAVLIISNLLLVYVNSSDNFALTTFITGFKNKIMMAVNGGIVAMLIVIIFTPLSGFLKLQTLTLKQFFICFAVSCVAVLWYEVVKIFKQKKQSIA